MLGKYLGLHAEPPTWLRWVLGILPFLLLVVVYVTTSDARLEENPNDKLFPSIETMADSMVRIATEPDKRSGDILLVKDTVTSLSRLGKGIGLAALVGLLVGLNAAFFPVFRHLVMPFVTALSNVPPLAVMPILMIIVGTEDQFKVILIFIGTVFVLSRDIFRSADAIPKEQITKALTLGASQFGVVYRVMLPQVLPKLLSSVRIVLGAAWLFLIAAEAVASTEGLGYRIFLVRRYLAMDLIIPYVLYITALAFVMDQALRFALRVGFPWFREE
ncbi:MAG: ABC transporter permease subunit [Acidobacteriota bacterium]